MFWDVKSYVQWRIHKLRVQAKFWLFTKITFFQRSLKTVFWQRIRNLRKNSCRSVPWVYSEVLSESSYGWTKVKLEFWSQCKVLCFGMESFMYNKGYISFGSKRNSEIFWVRGIHKLRVQAKFWFFAKITFFKDRLTRCFDNGFVIYAKFRVDLYPGFIQRCFLRRVVAWQR